jgi:hypothetical protein
MLLAVFLYAPASEAAEILGPDIRLAGQDIFVSTGLRLEEAEFSDISKGISREFVFYIDLFRVWRFWPDEFVLGRSVTRTIRCDPVKEEYIATSLMGTVLTEKRFPDCGSLLGWALNVKEIRLTNTAELEPADYFVKVFAEGGLRKLPPFIDLLFFFVREKEFSINKESLYFPINRW